MDTPNTQIMNIDSILQINRAYKFHNDLHRIIVTNNNSLLLRDLDESKYQSAFAWIMHPLVAYGLSLFNGQRTVSDVYRLLNIENQCSIEKFCELINRITDNTDSVYMSLSFGKVEIPRFFLNQYDGKGYRDVLKGININQIMQTLDIDSKRLYIPTNYMIMNTTACYTNCVYCYADRSHAPGRPFPFQRILELLEESSTLGINAIDIDGGDFFMYPQWYELLLAMHKYEYDPYVSTKMPLTESIVEKLVAADVKQVQLSLDSVRSEELGKMLQVNDSYYGKIKKGMDLLESRGIDMTIKPVITKYNDSIKGIEELLYFTSKYEHVTSINITPAGQSKFKKSVFFSSTAQLEKIAQKEDEWNDRFGKKIEVLEYNARPTFEEKTKTFEDRSICTGNRSSFFVLPDGKVTLCEQMYWHPFFILGDLFQNSIMEVWNSKKALELASFSKSDVRECSPCKKCDIFDQCRHNIGVCWRDAIAAYGDENYDYPSPECPYAPQVTNDFYID